jgi:hypothetical protein
MFLLHVFDILKGISLPVHTKFLAAADLYYPLLDSAPLFKAFALAANEENLLSGKAPRVPVA